MKENLRDYGGILPCGGKGTRLLELTGDSVPKSLFKVNGKELIRYSIDLFNPKNVKTIVFAINHKGDQIKQWLTTQELPYLVYFSGQTEPGVMGSIVAGSHNIAEDAMIACNTDEIRLGLNLQDVIGFHQKHETLVTMVTTYTNHLNRHRLIYINPRDNRIINTRLKPEEYKNHPEKPGLVNTGFLIMDKRALEYFDPQHGTDWNGIIDPLCDARQISAYIDRTIAYFNVGTPEEYQEAENYFNSSFAAAS